MFANHYLPYAIKNYWYKKLNSSFPHSYDRMSTGCELFNEE